MVTEHEGIEFKTDAKEYVAKYDICIETVKKKKKEQPSCNAVNNECFQDKHSSVALWEKKSLLCLYQKGDLWQLCVAIVFDIPCWKWFLDGFLFWWWKGS